MNNTTTKRNLTAIVAIFMAATLVVGTLATTITQTAFAFSKKKGDENSRNGNTITIQKCKQAAIQSGFDNNQEQECQNLICTHPGENATCTQEGAVAVTPIPTPKPTPKTCEECITTMLTPQQITALEFNLKGVDACQLVEEHRITEDDFKVTLIRSGVSGTTADDLIACLKNVGIVFLI